MTSTRDRILECALERFNSEGLPAVGLRDIASNLELSPGNVTYYFSRKEDLVRELAAQLAGLNDQSLEQHGETASFADLLGAIARGMDNHWRYRFMSASYVQVMTEYPSVADGYAEVEARRRRHIYESLVELRERGLVTSKSTDAALEQVTHAIALIARFGCPDRVVRSQIWKQTVDTRHYLGLIARVLHSIATARGKAELGTWLA